MTLGIEDYSAVFAALPNLHIDRDNVAHYRGLLEGRLLINRCDHCGYWIYPHRPLCPECLSWDVTPTEVSGRGSLFLFTLVQQPRDPNSRFDEPMIVASVALAEQPVRYLSTIVGCPVHRLRHDMPLRLVWIDKGEHRVPAFEPAPKGETD